MTPEKLARLKELSANATTKGPWRYAHLLDGIEARAVLDANGYLFGRIDDLNNGELICEMRNSIDEMIAEIERLNYIELIATWVVNHPEREGRLNRLQKALVGDSDFQRRTR